MTEQQAAPSPCFAMRTGRLAFGFSEKVTVNEAALLYVVEGNLLIDDIALEEGDHLRIDNNAAFSIAGNPVGRFVLVYTRCD